MAIYDKDHGGYRIFIGDLGSKVGKYDLQRELDYYGSIMDIWVARSPPGFAFAVFKYPEHAEKAVNDLHGRLLCGRVVRVKHAVPYRESLSPPCSCHRVLCGRRVRTEHAVPIGTPRRSVSSHSRSQRYRSRSGSREHKRRRSRSGERQRSRPRKSPSRSSRDSKTRNRHSEEGTNQNGLTKQTSPKTNGKNTTSDGDKKEVEQSSRFERGQKMNEAMDNSSDDDK